MYIPHLREFYGIVGKVDHDLLYADVVAIQFMGKVGIHIHRQFQLPVANPGHDDIRHIVDYRHGLIFRLVDGHHAGFYLGKVQSIVNDCEQRLSGCFDLSHILLGHGGEFLPQRHLRHTDNGVHGGSDFMTHVSQEIRLHVGRFHQFRILHIQLVLAKSNLR